MSTPHFLPSGFFITIITSRDKKLTVKPRYFEPLVPNQLAIGPARYATGWSSHNLRCETADGLLARYGFIF